MKFSQLKRHATTVMLAVILAICVILLSTQLQAHPARADTAPRDDSAAFALSDDEADAAVPAAAEGEYVYGTPLPEDVAAGSAVGPPSGVQAKSAAATARYTFTPPDDLMYDGTLKEGELTWEGEPAEPLYSSSMNAYEAAEPVDAGTYYVFAAVYSGGTHVGYMRVGQFTIQKKPLNVTLSIDGSSAASVTYNGEVHTITASADTGVEGESVTLGFKYGGTVSSALELTEAGIYHIRLQIMSAEGSSTGNYALPDDVADFEIERAPVAVPSISGEYVTDGEDHTVTWEGLDGSLMSVIRGGSYNAGGLYAATVSLNDIRNYQWEDGTASPKRIEFTVEVEMLDLIWLIIVLCVIIVAEVVIIFPLNKRRKRNAEENSSGGAAKEGATNVMAVAPLALLAANLPSGQLGALIGLGIAAVGLAVADTVLGIKGNKKKAKAQAEEAEEQAAAAEEPAPQPEPEPQAAPQPEPEPQPEPQPEPEPEPEPEPQPEPDQAAYEQPAYEQPEEYQPQPGPAPELVYDSGNRPEPEPEPEPADNREYATKVLYETKPDFVPVPTPVFVPAKSEPEPERQPQPLIPVILPDEDGNYTVRYLYSFLAKLIQSSPEVQQRYCNIIDIVHSYDDVKATMSWKHVRIYSGRKLLSYMVFRGKKLCITFALDPKEFADTKYRGIDVSDVKRYEKTPMMLKLTSDRRGKYSEYLLTLLLDREGFTHGEIEHTQIFLPFETREQLIRRNLIQVVRPDAAGGEKVRVDPETFRREMLAMREAYEEVQALADERGKVLTRYNYSFKSKLIQSVPDIQRRCGAILDHMRSYKKIKTAESWKQVRVYSGRKLYALLTFRGKKLCISFALDPEEFAATKYRGIDMSRIKRYSRTPLMLKITSERRMRYAMYLFDQVMERAGVPRGEEHSSEWEHEYQSREQLIADKLIKILNYELEGVGESEEVDFATAIRERIAMRRVQLEEERQAKTGSPREEAAAADATADDEDVQDEGEEQAEPEQAEGEVNSPAEA